MKNDYNYFKVCAGLSVAFVRFTRMLRASASPVRLQLILDFCKNFMIMLSGILCCLLALVAPCVPLMLLRGEAREKYNIEVRMMTFGSSVTNYQKDSDSFN